MNSFHHTQAVYRDSRLDGTDGLRALGPPVPMPKNDAFGFVFWTFDSVRTPAYTDQQWPKHKARCYHFIMTYNSCRARAYEEQQCRPAKDDVEECMLMGKHRAYLQRKSRWLASIPWDEQHRRWLETQEALMDRVGTDPRPLLDRVKDAKGRFDISSGRFDFNRLIQSFWGAGGTWVNPRSHWDEAMPGSEALDLEHPGWTMSQHKMRMPHPMVDERSWWARWLQGPAATAVPSTHVAKERLGWHPDTEVAVVG